MDRLLQGQENAAPSARYNSSTDSQLGRGPISSPYKPTSRMSSPVRVPPSSPKGETPGVAGAEGQAEDEDDGDSSTTDEQQPLAEESVEDAPATAAIETETSFAMPDGFEKNQIVWAKLGNDPYWPGWIDEWDDKKRQFKISFGYDEVKTVAIIAASRVEPFTGREDNDRLNGKAKFPAKAKKEKLLVAIERAVYEHTLWPTLEDHSRNCVCGSLDDGTFMFGCDGCDKCWYHGPCMGIKISEEMQADPSLIPPFECLLPCATCQEKSEEKQRLQWAKAMKERIRKKKELKKKKEKSGRKRTRPSSLSFASSAKKVQKVSRKSRDDDDEDATESEGEEEESMEDIDDSREEDRGDTAEDYS